MRVLVATNQRQGEHPADYSWTVEGELVTPVVAECASADRCGCARGFPGFASSRATTTAMVVDLPHLTRDDLWTAVHDWLERDGWFRLLPDDEHDDHEECVHELVSEHVEAIERVAWHFPLGAVVSRLNDHLWQRSLDAAA